MRAAYDATAAFRRCQLLSVSMPMLPPRQTVMDCGKGAQIAEIMAPQLKLFRMAEFTKFASAPRSLKLLKCLFSLHIRFHIFSSNHMNDFLAISSENSSFGEMVCHEPIVGASPRPSTIPNAHMKFYLA